MLIAEIDATLRAVCPIYGVDENGFVTYDPGATPQQITAAQQILAATQFPLNRKPASVKRAVHLVFQAIVGLNLSTAQYGQLMAAVTAFLIVNGGSFSGPDLLSYLQSEFPTINFPSGLQPNS